MRLRRTAMAASPLAGRRRGGAFAERLVRDLPAVARRYLLHAIAAGTPLAGVVELETTFSMKLEPRAKRPTELTGGETLAPLEGFVWAARARRGPFLIRVRDHYIDGEGGVRLTVFGVPAVIARGPDVTRSARHRLAIESIWLPSSLLPADNVVW